MTQNIKRQIISIGDYRAHLAEHLDNIARSGIYQIGDARRERDILTMSDKTLEREILRRSKYFHAIKHIDEMGVMDYTHLMRGHSTHDMNIEHLRMIEQIFLMARQIIVHAQTDGADETFNHISVSHIAHASQFDPGRPILTHAIRELSQELFQQNNFDMESLSLGLFIKHMRSGFTQNDILTNNTGEKSEIPKTLQPKLYDTLSPKHLMVISDALWAVQKLLLQPRKSRDAGESYENHLMRHTHYITQWRDEHIGILKNSD